MAARAGEGRLEEVAPAPLLFSLEGQPLTGLEFFGLDGFSLLLRFGGARLEVLSKARVRRGAGELTPQADGWRAALATLVFNKVRRIALDRGRELVIEFEGGSALAVSLRPEERAGPEAAVFFDEHWSYEPY